MRSEKHVGNRLRVGRRARFLPWATTFSAACRPSSMKASGLDFEVGRVARSDQLEQVFVCLHVFLSDVARLVRDLRAGGDSLLLEQAFVHQVLEVFLKLPGVEVALEHDVRPQGTFSAGIENRVDYLDVSPVGPPAF